MNPSLILHPLDYSASAKPALARALALAKWHGADLHVLHVRSRRRGIDGEEAAHARLRKFVEARNPQAAKFETVILAGDPVTAVADYARHTSLTSWWSTSMAAGPASCGERESSPRSWRAS
jgi:nucleotide-binding universal stress UspA family protein